MSAENVRVVVTVWIICYWVMLIIAFGSWMSGMKEMINPSLVAIRLWFGTIVLCAGLLLLRLGSRVADVNISLKFPGSQYE